MDDNKRASKKARRQAEAIERNEAYQKLSVEEKQKRNPKKKTEAANGAQ